MQTAISRAGSEKKLGELCGCSQNKIWLAKTHEKVDAELALKIEAAVGVPAREMRPDLPWPVQATS